jgi:hypothetical protein
VADEVGQTIIVEGVGEARVRPNSYLP